MARFELKLPAMGEGIIEASITKWFAGEGDAISEDEALVEVATDKVDSEIPSPVSGILKKIVYQEGEIPKVGEVIAVIETDLENKINEDEYIPERDTKETDPKPSEVVEILPVREYASEMSEQQPAFESSPDRNRVFLSPFIKNLAKQRGISPQELIHIKGTGSNDRITKDDLNNYILSGRPFKTFSGPAVRKEKQETVSQKKIESINENEEIIEMDRVRRLIAENMLKSKKTAPHVTSFIEADVTGLVTWRESIKEQFIKNAGVNLTYTSLITEIVAKSLREFPRINSSVEGDKILIKKEINIGIATALTNGNLIVSVIRQADKENLRGLAVKISDLTQRARQNKLLPAEIKGSTFTITNIGQYNSLTGTPIINLPEVAILAVGTIKKKPAVIKIQGGLGIGIRDIVVLSLTYDHRIIDGALGGSFLNSIANHLENFDINRVL
jgi:2-oxoglutarate dehydrogenase E2 component (dihydrolipoamide succinyltransferase)